MDVKQFVEIHRKSELSIQELFILLCLEEMSYFDIITEFGSKEYDSLKDKGYIKNDNISLEFKEKYMKDMGFEEIWETYPTVVGSRRLCIDQDICKKLYKMRIKTKEQHQKVIGAIKNEIRIRTLDNSLQYMVQLPKYLRNKRWEGYEIEQEIKKSEEVGLSEDI